MSHHNDKEDKKKKIRERNKRNWMIFQHAELHREQVDIGTPEIQGKLADKTVKKDEKLWSAQLTSIRNRLDNSRRLADDRWNRFAGTEGGGGRGR